MHQPKWFQSNRDIKECDIVLFIKHESTITRKYHEVLPSRDGIIRKVAVKYQNDQENVDRFIARAVRELVLIHGVDELNFMEELGKMATVAYLNQILNKKTPVIQRKLWLGNVK